MSYDNTVLGIENPMHPANQIEELEETQLSEAETELERLKKEISAIKSLFKAMQEMEAKEGIFSTCLGMDEETEETYLRYKASLTIKINRL